jgi:hypothetical protein
MKRAWTVRAPRRARVNGTPPRRLFLPRAAIPIMADKDGKSVVACVRDGLCR